MAGNKPFWSYVLSTSTPNYTDPTEYQLNFSVFCPLAYGAKGIIYFTYETIPERYGTNYGKAVIDNNGNPTKKYEIVREINQYVSNVIGPVIMNSKRIGTYHTSQNSDNEQLNKSQVLNSNSIVTQVNNANILIGVFKSSTSQYLLLVNKKNEELNNINISLKGNFTDRIKLYPRMSEYSGSIATKMINSNYAGGNTTFTIAKFLPGEAILVTF
jgi:hypothetical protein